MRSDIQTIEQIHDLRAFFFHAPGLLFVMLVVIAEKMKNAVAYLKKNLKPDDILLTLGAGDVWKVGERVLRELKK